MHLFNDGLNIRKVLKVFQDRTARVAYHSIDFFLGFPLEVGVNGHHLNEILEEDSRGVQSCL